MISRDSTDTITFILPCAGEGRRLGYDGPKELYPILPGVKLIDFSLDHIAASHRWLADFSNQRLRVVLTVRPWKMDIVDHVRQKLPGMMVDHVLFDETLFEWPGSVHSARNQYGNINVVLLPDSWMALSAENGAVDSAGRPVLYRIMRCLENHSVAFGYRRCDDADTLSRLGALHVTEGTGEVSIIDRFQDKPKQDQDKFNGYWCCYGFRPESAEMLYRFLRRSVLQVSADICDEAFYPVAAFPVAEYRDLGDPISVQEFRRSRFQLE